MMSSLKDRLLNLFGDIKLCPYPPFLYYYRGDYYKVSGKDTLDILSKVVPGDILCRGYDHYLDGYFIPGEYTHSGIYIGDGKIIHAIAEGVCECTLIDFVRCDRVIVLHTDDHMRREVAVERVKSWLDRPYDFSFSDGEDAFYCHELSARAYIEYNPQKIVPYLGFIRMVSMTPKYLAESLINNPMFTKVFEINEKGRKSE